MILGLFCLGSWASTFKFAGKWRSICSISISQSGFFLPRGFTRSRSETWGTTALTSSMTCSMRGKRQWMFGFMGGMVFNLGNMLMIAAISIAGLAAAFPMTMGVALLVGIGLGMAGRPAGNPMLLELGCALLLASVIVNALLYRISGNRRARGAGTVGAGQEYTASEPDQGNYSEPGGRHADRQFRSPAG